jgi:hypothetical protein
VALKLLCTPLMFRELQYVIIAFLSLLWCASPIARAEIAKTGQQAGIPISTNCIEQPAAWKLLSLGAAFGAIDYVAGVTAHEGAHALTALAFGAKVTRFDVLPKVQEDGTLLYGSMTWNGDLNDTERGIVLMAPKMLNLALLGGYTALIETDSLPNNKFAQLPLAVVAVGAWVDFSKDLFTKNPQRDTIKTFNLLGADTERERLPFRLAHGALALASGFEVGKGIYLLFKPPSKNTVTQITKYGSPVVKPNWVGWEGTF